jgi:hypothetical protein
VREGGHLLPKRHHIARLVALQHSGIRVPEARRVTGCEGRGQRAQGVLEIEHVFADEPEGPAGFRLEKPAAIGELTCMRMRMLAAQTRSFTWTKTAETGRRIRCQGSRMRMQ